MASTELNQRSNRIIPGFNSEQRRRLRRLSEALEQEAPEPQEVTTPIDYKIKYLIPNSTASSSNQFGIGFSSVGTFQLAASSDATLAESKSGLTFSGTTGTTSIGGMITTFVSRDAFVRPENQGGGFELGASVSASGVTVATARMFAGYSNTTSVFTDVEPSSLTNIIGIGFDSADTNLQIIHNDGSGTATKVDLGSSFPKPNTNYTFIYKFKLSCTDGATVDYEVTEVGTGATSSGTITTDLPSSTTGLGFSGYVSAGGTSTTSVFRVIRATEIQRNV